MRFERPTLAFRKVQEDACNIPPSCDATQPLQRPPPHPLSLVLSHRYAPRLRD